MINIIVIIICFYLYNETVNILITQFWFFTIFWLYIIIPKFISICDFLISIVNIFSEKIVLFLYYMTASLFSSYKFVISLFSNIFHGFLENYIIHQLEKIFFKIIYDFFLRSVFLSIYGFIQAFWSKLMILCTF